MKKKQKTTFFSLLTTYLSTNLLKLQKKSIEVLETLIFTANK